MIAFFAESRIEIPKNLLVYVSKWRISVKLLYI